MNATKEVIKAIRYRLRHLKVMEKELKTEEKQLHFAAHARIDELETLLTYVKELYHEQTIGQSKANRDAKHSRKTVSKLKIQSNSR